MGLFNFIKEAGAKLISGSAQAATSDNLKKQVVSHGFDASKLSIDVNRAKVKLSGSTMTQEQAEKIIFAVGNTVGVAEVDRATSRCIRARPRCRCTPS